APVTGPSWQGTSQGSLTPPDPNGAIGPNSYVETVNTRLAIYTRTGTQVANADFSVLTGNANGSDPMVLWDPDTQRFYYNIWNTANATMDWGFSTDSNPTAIPGSFCRYQTSFGYPTTSFPDYPKLGQTKNFLMIGVNFYPSSSSQQSTSSDVLWISKPQGQGVSTCPAASTFTSGKVTGLVNNDGSQAFTPVPVIQTDPATTGYVLGMSDIECPPVCGTGTKLTVFTVTDNGGVPAFSAPNSITVGSYQSPPAAPQRSSTRTLDTLDGRITHAVSGFDPTVGATALWVSHTVAGGAGSQINWYEVNTATGALAQSGSVSSNSLDLLNSGISPDRTCTAATCAHGTAMVLGFSTTSGSTFPAIQMVSKIGAAATSGLVLIKQSTTSDRNFSCSPCRWGDYGGATPDPAASLTAATGAVWLSNQWTTGGSAAASGDQTWNWQATP
ncbi:MAG TPA: hypothetical protein VJT31_42415, partial [Rugosimonospora sp.]|nr:hypothetical protein [Rugosimonospora sp.]